MQGFGKGNTATGRDSWQDLEERERTERSESGTGGVGQKIQLELVPPVPEKDISDKSQTENNTIKSGEFHPDTIVQHERKVRIGL